MEPYSEFARNERPRLVAFIRSNYSADHSRADDVAQEALLQGFKRDQERPFVSEQHRRNYVYQVARHQMIDEKRRERRQATTGVNESLSDIADPSETEIVEAETFIAGHAVETIRAALSRLPPKLYEILFLAFYEDMSNGKISETLTLTYDQVASRKHRALRRLRELLGEKDNE